MEKKSSNIVRNFVKQIIAEEMEDNKDIKQMASDFESTKTPKTTYNIKDRLDYYKDRKEKASDLSKDFISKIKLAHYGKFLGMYDIYEVNGDLIRTKVDIDFCSGGNPGRYAYVPEGEIWIDENLYPNDAAATVIHEFTECIIMKHKGKSYDHSHDKASAIELKFRKKHVKEEKQSIKTELKKASDFISDILTAKK
jgi:hypothetical protein